MSRYAHEGLWCLVLEVEHRRQPGERCGEHQRQLSLFHLQPPETTPTGRKTDKLEMIIEICIQELVEFM